MVTVRRKLVLLISIFVAGLLFLIGCQPDPQYDRRTIDLVYTGEQSIVAQTFTNVRPDTTFIKNEQKQARYQQWFCDDSSDTFQRKWKSFADRMGMQSLANRNIRVREYSGVGCDVALWGNQRGWLAPATVFTEVLASDTYVIRRSGSKFHLEIRPGPEASGDFEVNLWLSKQFRGRLIEANTPVFQSSPSDIRIIFQRIFSRNKNQSTTWRRARWSPQRIRKEGIRFTLDGPIIHGKENPTGLDNSPTWFPGKEQQK